ncbi:MAG: UDP-2,4-diacetamido-2,4,6-trideoxy-beta-L-altropyranose hydrolase [Candidatus Heimdallarchaeota archaeon LC_3]|nr:MAG: UDP-2,4-diacetamido-2,4,6-trideoxy-beta-L-altropyranose hydrolase [Candidatus Heimdallarchaeota archaeon LC_3]
MNKIPLIIRSDANTDIGIGHIMRCVALTEELLRNDFDVTILGNVESDKIKKLLKNNFKLKSISKIFPANEDLVEIKKLILEIQAKWVIIDGYHFDQQYLQELKSLTNVLLFDDFVHLEYYPVNIILNQNTDLYKDNYKTYKKTIKLNGLEYVILRDEFIQSRKTHKTVKKIAENLLITIGGSDKSNITFKIIKAINQLKSFAFKVKIVVGPVNIHYQEINDLVKNSNVSSNHNFDLITGNFNLSDLMNWSDIAITASGTTIWELAFMGVSFLYLKVEENQEVIVNELKKNNLGLYLGDGSNIVIEDVSKQINNLTKNYEIRKMFSQTGQALIDGKGKKRILENLKAFKV